MYSYYKAYYDFLEKYPRFKFTLISFDTLKTRIPRIIKWFESRECVSLPITNVTSFVYWKNDSPSYQDIENTMDIGVTKETEEVDGSYHPEETEEAEDDNDSVGSFGSIQKDLSEALPDVE